MLRAKFEEIEQDYWKLSPRGKWEFVRYVCNSILKITGVAMFDYKWKMTWVTLVPLGLYIELIASAVYTLWYYYFSGLSETPMKAFFFIPTFAYALPVT